MKHSILLVDDEVDNVDALERLFRRKFNVLKATSGKEAIQILKRNPVSLIITDQRMPGMSGVDLLAESMDYSPEAIRFLLTGYTDIDSVISAINSGQVYRYITKPWDPVDLTNAVDKAIERYELSAELKEKNLKLETALSELRTLDEAKSNFMILINHELKTPLTSMLSFLELLRETQLNQEQEKYLTRICQSAERLQTLIQDSLELVSAETGTMPIKNSSVHLKKLLAELVKAFEPMMEKKGMSVDLTLEVDGVKADGKALRSVLMRLLDNAVKFGNEKSVVELISRPLPGGRVEIILANEGKSLKSDALAKILKPFSLDEDIMHHSKGNGLGLSVVQAILRRLGAQLDLKSTKGKFLASISLPSD